MGTAFGALLLIALCANLRRAPDLGLMTSGPQMWKENYSRNRASDSPNNTMNPPQGEASRATVGSAHHSYRYECKMLYSGDKSKSARNNKSRPLSLMSPCRCSARVLGNRPRLRQGL